MSAGPQLDGSDGGDTGEISDTGRQDRVNDAVAEFERDRQSVDGRIQVADMEPEPTRQIGTADAGPQLDGGFEGTERETDTDRTADTPQRDPSPGPTPEDLIEPAPSEPVDQGGELEQGIEESGATEGVERQAQDFEQEVLAENPGLTERDVSVSLIGSQAGPTFQAAFTEGAEARVRDRLRNIAAGLGLGPGSLAATGGTDSAAETQAEQRAERRAALEGIGAFDELAEQEQEALDAIEAQLERAIGEQRAATFGAVDPAQTRQIIERTDLERGEDFTIQAGEPETRTFTDPETGEQVTETVTPLEARLTEDFERQFLEEVTGFSLAQQFGTEFVPGEDFTVADDGEVELTDTGAQKAQTQNIRGLVADLESRVFDVPVLGQFQVEVPGEGPLVETAEQQDLGTGAEAIRVRAGPEDEFMTLQEAISAGAETIYDATQVSEQAPIEGVEPGRGRAGAAARQEQAQFTGEGRQPAAQASSAILRTPAFLLEGVNLGIDAAEFGAEALGGANVQVGPSGVGVTADEERLNELFGNLETATAQSLASAADVFAEDPGEFAARGVGSIIGTAGLFGAARLAGRVPSGVTRGLIQPGEEIAGIGGNRLTRAIAGERTAERLFPANEPLIFSEEAVLRRMGQAGRRTSAAGAVARARLAEEAVGARFRLAEMRSGDVPTRPLGVGERVRRAQTSARFRMAELDPRTEVASPVTRLIRRGVDDAEDIIDRIEIENNRIGAGLGAVPEVRLRPRAETEAESEQEVVERVGEGEVDQPSVEVDTESEAMDRMRRAESAVAAEDTLDDATARRVAAEASAARERGQTELMGGRLGEPALDQRLEELLEPAAEADQRLDIDERLELRTELEQRLEGRTELRTRAETEVRIEPREREVLQEVEAKAEAEAEQEQRQEQRAESEAEAELFDRQLLEDEDDLVAAFVGEERFGSGIAGEGEAALENIEQELVEGFEEGEAGAAELEDFKDAEKDILEG